MAEALSSFSEGLAEAVAKAGASVVRVEGRRRMAASGVVWSTEGVVVTAHHVVEREEGIMVGLADGRSVAATLAGRDAATDLAVLRAGASGLTPPTWSEGEGLRVGHVVLALGRPGRSVRATLGIVSALGEEWTTPLGGRLDRYLETDTEMLPGFSGGPLVDVRGRVLGITTSGLQRGASLAAPTPTLRRVVETLLAQGRVPRGYLGVGGRPVRLPEGLAQELGQEWGLMVLSVEPQSPADRAGLFLGDTIVRVAEQPVRHRDDLRAALTGERIGTAAPVRIVRAGRPQEVSVIVGERP